MMQVIAKRSAKFDLGKFEDEYEVVVNELVDAKINHLPVPGTTLRERLPEKLLT